MTDKEFRRFKADHYGSKIHVYVLMTKHELLLVTLERKDQLGIFLSHTDVVNADNAGAFICEVLWN